MCCAHPELIGSATCVQGLEKLLQSGEVLHVVLRLIEVLRDRDVDLLPPRLYELCYVKVI